MTSALVAFCFSSPLSMIPILLQTSASSGKIWLLTMIVLPISPSRLSRFRISIRARGSNPDNGSSNSKHLRIMQQGPSQPQTLRLAA